MRSCDDRVGEEKYILLTCVESIAAKHNAEDYNIILIRETISEIKN